MGITTIPITGLEGSIHSMSPFIVKSLELCLAESKLSVCVCVCVCAQLCLTLCSSMDCNQPGSSVLEFPRREYWSGLPFPTPGYLPDPGIEPTSPALAGGFFTTGATREAQALHAQCYFIRKHERDTICGKVQNPLGVWVGAFVSEMDASKPSCSSVSPREL